jgi:hypothetical protein
MVIKDAPCNNDANVDFTDQHQSLRSSPSTNTIGKAPGNSAFAEIGRIGILLAVAPMAIMELCHSDQRGLSPNMGLIKQRLALMIVMAVVNLLLEITSLKGLATARDLPKTR